MMWGKRTLSFDIGSYGVFMQLMGRFWEKVTFHLLKSNKCMCVMAFLGNRGPEKRVNHEHYYLKNKSGAFFNM